MGLDVLGGFSGLGVKGFGLGLHGSRRRSRNSKLGLSAEPLETSNLAPMSYHMGSSLNYGPF